MAKFRIEAAQVESLYGWVSGNGWHPCLLAVVNSDNDYAFATAPLTGDPISARRNNLAQRNLSVIDVLANASASFPFVAGSRFNREARMTLVIDRSQLPPDMPLRLSLDEDGAAFPELDFEHQHDPAPDHGQDDGMDKDCGLVFLDDARVKTRFACCCGILTLAKGSRFDCLPRHKPGNVTVEGGDVVLRNGKRYVEIRQSQVRITMEKDPAIMYPLALQTTIPNAAAIGEQYPIHVAQLNSQGVPVGGASMVYHVS